MTIAQDLDDFAVNVISTATAGLFTERLHQGISIKPAFARASPATGRQIRCVHPRVFLGQIIGFHPDDITAKFGLGRMVMTQDIAALIGCQNEIALFMQGNVDFRVKVAVQIAQELNAIGRHFNIDRGRELLADRRS